MRPCEKTPRNKAGVLRLQFLQNMELLMECVFACPAVANKSEFASVVVIHVPLTEKDVLPPRGSSLITVYFTQ